MEGKQAKVIPNMSVLVFIDLLQIKSALNKLLNGNPMHKIDFTRLYCMQSHFGKTQLMFCQNVTKTAFSDDLSAGMQHSAHETM